MINIFFKLNREGSNVVTKLNLEIDEQQYENRGRSLTNDPSNDLEKLLQETISTGSVGSLTLDKQYLIFQPAQCKEYLNIYKELIRSFYTLILRK